jgi:FAD:protein FMN transferase
LLWKASLALFIVLAGEVPVTREVYLMGTRTILTSYASTKGHEQLENHIRILEETESELSVWRPDTPLSRLNAHPVGTGFEAGSQLVALFEELRFWWRESGGAFDPGIGRILDARGFYGRKPTEAAPLVSGVEHLRLEPSTGRIFRTADIWMDSGAFGKGEALDRVRRESQRNNDAPWMIDLGGQIMVYGIPPGRASWTVDIAHPQKRDSVAFTLELTSGSISISGNSEQPGHILDPRTQKPVLFQGSVVVWHERGLIADIISTALFVMGPEKGLAWAESRGIAACFVLPNSETLATTAFSNFRKGN